MIFIVKIEKIFYLQNVVACTMYIVHSLHRVHFFLKKTALRKNPVSGTVLMIQLK